jgi:hypothetical protein
MNRRILLRGLGGAVVAAPFLGSLGGRGAKAQSVSPPKRLIAMFTHYGCITTRFFPKKSHGALEAADLLPTTLAPLAPYVSKLLIPRGIRAMNEWNVNMSRGQGNDPFLNVYGSYFTCQPVSPNSNDPFSFNSATKFNAMPLGPSLDHVMAQQLSPQGTPLFMNVSGHLKESPQSAISYKAAATRFDAQPLAQTYSALTGLFQPDTPTSPDSYQAARGKSVLDLVKDDLETLQRFDMSRSDRMKLEAWKELLQQTGKVITAAQCNQEVATRLGATQANVDATATHLPEYDVVTSKITDSLDAADVYSAVAVLSAACNVNPIIWLKYPSNFLFTGLGIRQDSANLGKRLDNASMEGPCVPDAIEMLLKIDGYYAQKFAKLVAMLDSIPESDGTTTLDNSAAVWFQDVSDGAARNLNNLPIIQAGGAGGYFKTGWAVNVDDGSPNLSNGNSESVCMPGTPDRIDGTTQSTGTDAKLANAPINKYYCNLMNALGVTADGDGFPAAGGAAEVTHFGMYDKTEDFIGGGSNPPTIHDPGEFKALKANV